MATIRLREDQPFDLALSLSCGQAFRWEEREGWWEGVVEEGLWRIRQEGDRVIYSGAKASAVRHYLALDEDLPAILSSIDRDALIHAAIERCHGLRILRQDPWEVLISFICATNTNIPRIRKMIASLARCFGRRVPAAYGPLFSFPTPETLSGSCGDHLGGCRLGYRDRYVAGTAAIMAEDPGLLKRIAVLPFNEARAVLLSFPGVGPKAADCILLFGFHRLESFPVDVWIRRIMHEHYVAPPPGMRGSSEKEDRRIREFGREYFGEFAGYAQEYLFSARELLKEGGIRSPGSSSPGTPPARR
ncbi:MAG: 8-oxoguanine DNA glycosylase [Methanomicrobiales archaeon]|nr:8-oxoguanine DNA glycosylase [Methanomicrobiales archaeon]